MIKFTKNFDDGRTRIEGYPFTNAELLVLLDENYVITPKVAINMFLDMSARMTRIAHGQPNSENDFDGTEIPFVVPPEGCFLNSHYCTETTPLKALQAMRGIRIDLVDNRRKMRGAPVKVDEPVASNKLFIKGGVFTVSELESIIAKHLAKE
jgi:hypothetical protein